MRHLLYNRILPVLTFVPIVFGLTGYVLSRITDMTIVMWELGREMLLRDDGWVPAGPDPAVQTSLNSRVWAVAG